MTIASKRRYEVERILPTLDFRPYIGGEFVDLSSSDVLPVTDPYTGDTVINIPHSGECEVNLAVAAARQAFDSGSWSGLHPRERASYMFKLADLIDKNLETIALVETLDTGRPYLGTIGWEVPNASEVFRYYAGWCDKIMGHTLPGVMDVCIENHQEPVGVCAAIPAWNFPFAGLAWKMAPALAAGCTIVVKAAERAPLTTLLLATYVNQAGFPAGTVNIVAGVGNTADRKSVV